jgi:hypothetical protein
MIEIALGFQILVWLVVLGVFLASGQASVFHPLGMYWAFHGLVFVIRPLLVYYLGFNRVWEYMRFEPSPDEFVKTLAVTSTGLVVLTATCLWFGKANPRFNGPVPRFSLEQSRGLVITTVLLLPLCVYSIYAAYHETGGERAANGVFIHTGTTGYALDAQFMLAPLLCLWLLKTRFHWLNLIPILLYVAYRSWIGNARWTFVLFFITLTLQYCWYRRLRWLQVWTLALAVPVLILFNIVGHDRGAVRAFLSNDTSDREQIDTTAGMSVVEKRNARWDTQDFANFDYLTAIISSVPERTSTYTYGVQYLQLFTEPIPRVLWHGKPAGAPVATFNINNYCNFLGLTFSLVGDGWSSGGWIGVIVTLGLVGAILGFAHRAFWANSDRAMLSLCYLSFLAISPNWFRDGGISVFKFLLWTWLPILVLPVVIWVIGHRQVPGSEIIIRRGEKLRIVQTENR